MKRVVCSLALVSAFSLAGLTACGDKVNVVQPGADSSVTSVSVTPPSANLNVGDKVTFTATVTGGSGLTNRNVTWSSSTPTVATVDATTGVVTAVAGGTTSIIATSSANSAVRGAAAVTVAAAVQPTVTISTINQTIPGTGSVPANLSAVTNQLDVTLNVDPGTQKLSEVQLLMNCGGADTIVARQPIGSADKAPIDAEESSAPVTLSFNTAAFNTATGAVAFKNGACTIKGKAITTTGTFVATSGTPLTLANVDFISTVTTTTPSTGQVASAAAANGLVWRAGAVNVTAIPVLYSGATIASGTISLVNAGVSDAFGRNAAVVNGVNGPGSNVIASLSNLTPSGGVITATFPNTTSSTNQGVAGTTVDTLFTEVRTVSSTGNAGPSLTVPAIVAPATAPAVGTNFIRLDNLAPSTAVAPVVNFQVQNTQNNWVGSAYVFSTSGSSKPITLDTSTTNDKAGVDVVKTTTMWRAAGTTGAFTAFSKTTDLAETSSSSALELGLVICDALGNCNTGTSPNNAIVGATPWLFGVDLTPPTLTQLSSGVHDGNVFAIGSPAPVSADFSVFDPVGAGGVSGSGTGPNGLLVKDQALKPTATIPGSGTDCPIGTVASGSAFPTQTCTGPVLKPNTVLLPAGAVVDGEYTMTVQAADQAGNTSAAVTIKYYVDMTAPTIPAQGVSIPNPITAGTSFSGFSATDNMDVKSGSGSLVFVSPAVHFAEGGTAAPTGVTFDNVLTQQSTVGTTLSVFYKSLTNGVATAATKPDSVDINVVDAAGNQGTAMQTALPAANIAALPAALFNAGTNAITAFSIDSAAPAAAIGAGVKTGTAITLYVNATPFDNTTGNPLSQVCFYYKVATNNQFGSGAAANDLVKIGCTGGAGTVGVGPTRRFFYSFAWTPSAAFAPPVSGTQAVPVYAVGNTAALDAIISAPVTVTITNPP